MRFRDGVLDVVGNCRRSATPNALFKFRFLGAPIDVTPPLFKVAAVLFFKSRLQLNHVPVHETHSAKVTTTSKSPSLNR